MAHHLVFYSKPGCHLCDEARQMLASLDNEFKFLVTEVDITNDAALFKMYFDQIPVLRIDHHTTLTAPIRLADVRAALTLP